MSRSSLTLPESERLVKRLKNTNLEKFHTMCKMHLSFLLDLPGSSLEDFLGENLQVNGTDGKGKRNFAHFVKRKVSKGDRTSSESSLVGGTLTQESIQQVFKLVEFLKRPENICQEGLFRKTGQLGRQKVLKEMLNNGDELDLELGSFSAHDCASVLKTFLGELPEPLLTEKHYLAHCQVPGMLADMEKSGENIDPNLLPVLEIRRIQTVQLLFQLLPKENATLLECVLRLLHRVAKEEGNKMTADTLGTMFSPHILVPRKMTATELQSVAGNMSKAVSFMIEKAPQLFQVPDALLRDIKHYWEEMEELDSQPSGCIEHKQDSCRTRFKKTSDSLEDAVHTTVSFTDRQASQEAANHINTQLELAQLYAHVSSMPDSAKKRKLLKQFNKASGVGTPVVLTMPSKHKRSKSVGEAIKNSRRRKYLSSCTDASSTSVVVETKNRIVNLSHGKNHRRRGSGHNIQVHSVTNENTPAPVPTPTTAVPPTHTPPVIRAKSRMRPADTAVMRLFKKEMETKLPASPVHIVDMKQNPASPAAILYRKRKCELSTTRSRSAEDLEKAHMEKCPNSVLEHLREYETPGGRSPHKRTPSTNTSNQTASKMITFNSPISHSMKKAPKSVQMHVMTPGSRAPMAMLQTP